MNEEEYLDEQQQHAKAAIGRALRDLKIDSIKTVDPRLWAKAHPWKTVAVAALAGFAAGDVAATAAKAKTRPGSQPEPEKQGSADRPADSKGRAGAGTFILNVIKRTQSLIRFVEPFLMEMWAARQAAEHGNKGNGHHPPPPPVTPNGGVEHRI